MTDPAQIRKWKSYCFYREELEKLLKLGLPKEQALKVLRIIHDAVDWHHGYKYAWLSDKADEAISLIEKEAGL